MSRTRYSTTGSCAPRIYMAHCDGHLYLCKIYLFKNESRYFDTLNLWQGSFLHERLVFVISISSFPI
jgi:hypothetical protein